MAAPAAETGRLDGAGEAKGRLQNDRTPVLPDGLLISRFYEAIFAEAYSINGAREASVGIEVPNPESAR